MIGVIGEWIGGIQEYSSVDVNAARVEIASHGGAFD